MSKYLVIDNYNSINEEFETIEEAFAQAEACIEDAGIDGWPQEILDGCVKICIVTHQSSPQNMRDTKNPDWDFECDVEMTETEHYLEIKKLQHQLEIQTKRVENLKKSNEFYADTHSWGMNAMASASTVVSSNDWESSREIPIIAKGFSVGGKLARSCQAIDQELEKQLEEVK